LLDTTAGATTAGIIYGEFTMDLNMTEIGNQKVQFSDHSHSKLSGLWQEGPLVLVFLRHYG
jgi:hypothetical protein